jgi:two-component system, NtrC family, sensor histidine kinase HydH
MSGQGAGSGELGELLTLASSVLVSAKDEPRARQGLLEAFSDSALWARFVRDTPQTRGADPALAEALAVRRPIFPATGAQGPTRLLLPFEGPDGVEVLELRGHGLSAAQAPLLELFARTLGAALQSQRRMEDTRLLLDLARTTSGTLDLTSILEAACDFMVRLFDVSNAFVLLLDPKRRVLVGAAASSAQREFVRGLEVPLDARSTVAAAARTRSPQIVEDVATHPDVGRPAVVQALGEKALLSLPLISRDELLGVVVLDETRGPRTFGADLVERAEVSIGQIAMSVSNARLYESLRRSYAELDATRAEMVARERLAALGELSAVVAHEVRNPLGVIFNAVSSLRRLSTPNPSPHALSDMQMLLDIVGEESERLNRMVGELLDFARPRALCTRPEDFARLVMESVEAARLAVEPDRARFVVELSGGLPRVPVDGDQLRQALINVTVNAAQATPPGGKVTLRVFVCEAAPEGPCLCVEVADQGPGISPELLPRIFEPFFTTKARGSGLGLAVVKRILEDHQGEVLVRSEAGRGATFVFRLPLHPAGC